MFSRSGLIFATEAIVFMQGLSAIQITSPTKDSNWNLKEANTVTWTSVDTDPSSFSVALTNNNANCAPTGFSQPISQNVSTASGHFEVPPQSSVKSCGGYKIAFQAQNNGILAESAPFMVNGDAMEHAKDNATMQSNYSMAADNTKKLTTETHVSQNETKHKPEGDPSSPASSVVSSASVISIAVALGGFYLFL